MRRVLFAAAVLMGVAVMPPPSVHAAVKTKVNGEVRLTLKGKQLTARIFDRPNFSRSPSLESEVFGKRIDALCATRFRTRKGDLVAAARRWPRGAATLTFDFDRDISRRAKWCLIEGPGGGDIVFVSFLKGERGRQLDKGRSPSGQSWRLRARVNARLAPCVTLRTADGGFETCFSDVGEREARLSTYASLPSCSGDTFLIGVTARSAGKVVVTLHDGTTVEAERYRRPSGSRARAQYFIAVLPGRVRARAVDARRGDGGLIARVVGDDLVPRHFAVPECDPISDGDGLAE